MTKNMEDEGFIVGGGGTWRAGFTTEPYTLRNVPHVWYVIS